jgi:hypothetical protein
MKQPNSPPPGKMKVAEKPQGKIGGSGVNKKVVKESVPQVIAKVKIGVPTQKQRM